MSERVPAAAIVGLIADALGVAGLPDADAAKVAAADARGGPHRGGRPWRVPAAAICASPARRRGQSAARHPGRPRPAPATALVDGDNGMGHLVMARAAATAIALARALRHRLGRRARAPTTPAPPGSTLRCRSPTAWSASTRWSPAPTTWRCGAAPRRCSAPIRWRSRSRPATEAPVVLDIATTVVSYGTVKNYRLQGKPMPEGWMVNREDGAPLTDPAQSAEGLLLPIGGYKGAGLALVLGLLAGTLNGAAFGRDVIDFNCRRRPAPATLATSSSRSTSRASCRSPISTPRSTATCAICAARSGCPASTRSGCRASERRAPARGSRSATACRWRRS